MRALRFAKYGPPSVLSLDDIASPVLKSGEALVEVHAAAINPSDVKNVAGAFEATLPRTPGRDYAGIVVAGEGWKGREVWGSGEGLASRETARMRNISSCRPAGFRKSLRISRWSRRQRPACPISRHGRHLSIQPTSSPAKQF